MTGRDAKVARAQELRAQGLLLRQIADRMGVPYGTAEAWLNDPDLSKLRARKASYSTPCVECGAPTSGCNGRKPDSHCGPCGSRLGQQRGPAILMAAAEPRYRQIERMWQNGLTLREIAAELDTTISSLSVTLARLRKRDGYSLPYRRPPRGTR